MATPPAASAPDIQDTLRAIWLDPHLAIYTIGHEMT